MAAVRALRSRKLSTNASWSSFVNSFVVVAPEVKEALHAGRPVVALESTIISHGMPYPDNIACALSVENIVRKNGAVPATIAIIDGMVQVGLAEEPLERLGAYLLSLPLSPRH